MESIPTKRVLQLLVTVLIIPFVVAVVVVQGSQVTQNKPVEPVSYSQEQGKLAPNYGDGGAWEVGTEQAGDNLEAHANAESYGLYAKLGSCGWNRRYRYSDYWSWEQDFKRTSAGGTEPYYLDSVDLQFYVGHGGPGFFTFVSNVDDHYLTTSDCYRSWGNGDNEWVALTSCQVLADSYLAPWARCMYGTHLILGFKTNAAANSHWWRTTGYWFAYYLCHNYTVAQAWYKAADRAQPSGRIVRAVINELAYLNDRPMSSYVGGPDSYDWDAWVQTHVAGSEPARYVDVDLLARTMPVFSTPPLSLAEAQNQYSNLGSAFNVPVPQRMLAPSAQGDLWTNVSGGRELEMDSTGGLYGYMDLNNMWTYTQTQRATLAPARSLLTPETARSIADQFLTTNGLMPSDAQFYEVVSDTVSGGDIVSGTLQAMTDSLLANETPTMYQVIYSRIISYTPPSVGNAPRQTVDFSVVGPGAKLKVYVDPTGVTPGKSALASSIVGAQGGWRATSAQRGLTRPEAVETIPILSPSQIYNLHDNLGDLVVLNQPPLEYTATQIISHTVAYWEHGAGSSQSELIPVYSLEVEYTLVNGQQVVDYVYIPANETYMRPFPRITTYPTSTVQVGEAVNLEALDASTPLDQLGYDPILNFPLGSGLPGDYIYDWYVGSVAPENKVGSGRAFTYTVTADVEARVEGNTQTIILMVTDINNPDQNSTTTSVTLDVFPRVMLPAIMRR